MKKKKINKTKLNKAKKNKSKTKSRSQFKSKNKLTITKDITFADLLQNYPESFEILMEKGMHCIGCGMAAMETLQQGALMHGLDPDEIVKEINNKINKRK